LVSTPTAVRVRHESYVFLAKITAICSFRHRLHTYDSAFHLPRDSRWLSALLLSNNTNGVAIGECSAYSSLQADSNVKFVA